MRLLVDRDLHPALWWIWAAAMAVAATRTTHVAYALVIIGVSAVMVSRFRSDAPWSRAFAVSMTIAGVVLAIRVVIGLLFAVPTPGNTVFSLPRLKMPDWFVGVTIGGPVTSERLGSVLSEGLVIVAMIAAVGAATALTNPRRLLRILPNAVHEAGVAVVVATTFVPQLVISVRRVQEARRLRGHAVTGVAGVRGLARPVVDDAIERAMALAAAMESRGYGQRSADRTAASDSLFLAAVLALAFGGFGMLSYGLTSASALGSFALGFGFAAVGLHLAGRSQPRSSYRPARWGGAEWLILAPALAAAGLMAAFSGTVLRPDYSASLLPMPELAPLLTLLTPLITNLVVRVR